MGNVKGIEDWICRILEFSINISYRFVQNHPFVFSVLMFFFLVYIFLPFVLNFLAYTSPFIVCVAILLRIFWSSEQSYIYCVKGDGKRENGMLQRNSGSVEYDIAFNRNDCSYFQSETSRRRNVKQKNREMDEQTGKKEEESYSSKHGTFTDVSAAEDIRSLVKHRPFLSSEDLESQIRSSDGTQQACEFDVGGTRIEATKMEEADDDDEEETQEDRNSAVKWTEDDQKNLMDLGFSEIERNRRLESLIAKRRAKKLYSMQVERGWGGMRSVPSSQISPIFARNKTIDLSSILNETEGLELPDTAPSILFPKQNPFDLPYDPLEEKPNLRGDSFHQEFMATHKEPLFCRHESFSLGPSFPLESKQDRRGKNFNPFFVAEKKGVLEGSGYSIFKRQPGTGDHDQLTEQLVVHKEDIHGTPDLVETGAEPPNQITNSVEITHEEDINNKNDTNDIKGEEEMERSHGMESLSSSDESNSLSSSEENEQNFNAYVAGVLEDVEESNTAQKSTSSLLVEAENDPFDSSLSANEMNRRGGRHIFAGQCSHHTSNCSIASDLQVEVSEVGSPPLTVNGSNSPTDGGESLTYDEESEKENTFGSEEMWGASSQQSGIEENEEESRGTHEVSQGDIVGLGLSRANESSEDVVASPINPLKVDDQESTDVSSVSSSTIDISGDQQAWSINIDPKIHDDIKQVVGGVLDSKSQFSDYSDPSSFGNLNKTMQLEFVPHSYEIHSEKPEDLSYPHKTNVVYDVDHTVDSAISNTEELKMNEDTDDGWQLLNKQEIEKPTEHQAISDSEKPIEEISKPNEDAGGNQVKLTENEIIMAMPKPIEAKEYFESPQESGGEQSIVDSGASGVTQNSDSDDPIASAAQQDPVIEEVTIKSSPSPSPKSISIQTSGVNQSYDDHNAEQQELTIQDVLINSSSSSPKSVFIENILIDQTSSSNANQRINVDTSQSHLGDTTKIGPLDEQPPLNLALENLGSIQENGDEQSVISRGTFAVYQNDDDPMASTELQELATEDDLINSTSPSSKPLFTENISNDQASSSNANQRIHLDNLQSHLEDTTKTSILYEQSPLNLAPENLESIQQSGDEVLPSGAFGMNQNYADPNASTEQQESSIEDDVHINSSSSSPKSVLTENTSMNQLSSNSNPIHRDILQSQLENTEKASTLDEQPPLNLAPENSKSIQEYGDEQVVIASEASGLYHNFDDPNASVAQKEWVIEEATSNSSCSSSPKSILAGKIQIGQASSYPNQKIHMDILQSLLEDITNTNSSEKQQTLNLTPTGPQNAVEDSTTCPSYNLGSENLLEPSNPQEKSTEETITIDDLNEPKPEDMHRKENSQSYQAIKDESETRISHTASTGLSKPIEDNNNILGIMEPGKFIAEASAIYKVNDPIVSEKEDNKIFKSVEKSQGDQSQSFIKQETVLESPEPDEPTGSKLTEDLHGNSRKLSEGEALCGGPLKSLEEIDDSRTEEENEDSRKLHEHDTIIHLPNSGYTTCNSEESQKLTECEAVDPSKLAVEKGNPNVPATIVEEDPSNPNFPVKSISES